MKDMKHVLQVIVEIAYSVLVFMNKGAFPKTEKYIYTLYIYTILKCFTVFYHNSFYHANLQICA